MKALGTDGPVFVAPYRPDQGGTDFLGLRQVNVDLMDECLPGFNNVCSYVRPFSLISWIYWKFYHLAEDARMEKANFDQVQVFQEKAEILFTWGHILRGVRGIPGTDSRPPRVGRVALDFESWKRIPSSTSLMAAVQYGPAAKTSDGLGFIEPVPQARGMFHTTGLGIELAQGLDESLRGRDAAKLLSTLKHSTGTEDDASKLFPGWSILTPTKKEKDAFRIAFFDKLADDTEALGRRSSTLKLILSALDHASRPLTVDQVRDVMFHNTGRRAATSYGQAGRSWHRWIVLQVRQAQRLAMETILSWIEGRLNRAHERETSSMLNKAMELRSQHAVVVPIGSKVGDVCTRLFPKTPTLGTLLASSEKSSDYNLLELRERILALVRDGAEESLLYAIRVLYICAEFTDALEQLETVSDLLRYGGAERISLSYWRDFVRRSANTPFDEFLRLVFEQYIISQHLSVAARRFDGGTQRLRITIEEDGLTPLISEALPLRVTADRLATALSLMSDCGMIEHTSDWKFASEKRPPN